LLAANCPCTLREVALQARHLEPLLRELALSRPRRFAVEDGRLSPDDMELLLELREEPERSRSARSRAAGSPILLRTNSRMIAPKPQQMQSRKERLNTSNGAAPSRLTARARGGQ